MKMAVGLLKKSIMGMTFLLPIKKQGVCNSMPMLHLCASMSKLRGVITFITQGIIKLMLYLGESFIILPSDGSLRKNSNLNKLTL